MPFALCALQCPGAHSQEWDEGPRGLTLSPIGELGDGSIMTILSIHMRLIYHYSMILLVLTMVSSMSVILPSTYHSLCIEDNIPS